VGRKPEHFLQTVKKYCLLQRFSLQASKGIKNHRFQENRERGAVLCFVWLHGVFSRNPVELLAAW
jgi:hypothetical protein